MLIFENFIHFVEFTIKFQVQKLPVTYFRDLVLMVHPAIENLGTCKNFVIGCYQLWASLHWLHL